LLPNPVKYIVAENSAVVRTLMSPGNPPVSTSFDSLITLLLIGVSSLVVVGKVAFTVAVCPLESKLVAGMPAMDQPAAAENIQPLFAVRFTVAV